MHPESHPPFPFFLQVLHFAHGERFKFIEIHILDDSLPEGDEQFLVILADPSTGLELGANVTGTGV